MALAPVILALAFSLAILNAGGTRLGLMGARLHLGALVAPGVLPCGCFPPSSAVFMAGLAAGLLGAVPEVLGVTLSSAMANRAQGILHDPVALFGVCFVLAIYNTNSYLLTHQPATHNPTQYPTVYILPHPSLP